MKHARYLTASLLLVPGVVFAAAVAPPVPNIDDPPQGGLVGAWYRLELDGAYVGQTHTSCHRVGQDIIAIEEP